MRIQTQEAPSMLLRVNFPVMACSPSLDLPLARLACRNAVIDPCDAPSGSVMLGLAPAAVSVPGTPPFCRVCWMICTPLLMQASAAFRVLSRRRSPPAILISRLVDVIAATPMTVRMMVSIRTVIIAMPSSRPSTALRAIRSGFSMVLRLSRGHDRRFLDLPLARLARGHAGIHACDVTSGLCHAASRRVGITIDPIENLDTAARGAAARPLIASRELQRGPGFGLGIEAVNVDVHGVVGDRQDGIARRAHRRIRAVRVAIRLSDDLRLQRVLPGRRPQRQRDARIGAGTGPRGP